VFVDAIGQSDSPTFDRFVVSALSVAMPGGVTVPADHGRLGLGYGYVRERLWWDMPLSSSAIVL